MPDAPTANTRRRPIRRSPSPNSLCSGAAARERCPPMVDRHHVLEGCLNLRDLGGYPTEDGRQVRWGCVFRAGELCLLTDSDADAITRLGIRVVVDLRNQWERAARPDRLPPGIDLVERRS